MFSLGFNYTNIIPLLCARSTGVKSSRCNEKMRSIPSQVCQLPGFPVTPCQTSVLRIPSSGTQIYHYKKGGSKGGKGEGRKEEREGGRKGGREGKGFPVYYATGRQTRAFANSRRPRNPIRNQLPSGALGLSKHAAQLTG